MKLSTERERSGAAPAADTVELPGRWHSRDYFRVNWKLALGGPSFWLQAFLIPGVLIAVYVIRRAQGYPMGGATAPLLVYTVGWAAVCFALMYFRIRKGWRGARDANIIWTVGPGGLRAQSSEGTIETPWDQIAKAKETPGAMLIWKASGPVLMIPLADVSEERRERIRQRFTERVPAFVPAAQARP